MEEKVTVLLDVDGTVANLLETLVRYLRKKGKIGAKVVMLYKVWRFLGRFGKVGGGGKVYREAYQRFLEVLRDEKERRELREEIKSSIYRDVLDVLRWLSSSGKVRLVLLSNAPHHGVRLLQEVLEEMGVNVEAAIGSHPVLGSGKKAVWELGLLPTHWLQGPLLRVDNRDNERDVQRMEKAYPHLHTVFVEDRWRDVRGDPSFASVDWEEEIERALEKWRKARKNERGER